MRIFVDADACPVVSQASAASRRHVGPVTRRGDTTQWRRSDYSEVKVIGAGADAVDFALVNLCRAGDIVVTQDYGVAAMALGKRAYALHQDGWQYTDENIDRLLAERHMAKKARRASHRNHLKGPRKRTEAEDARFAESLERLLASIDGK